MTLFIAVLVLGVLPLAALLLIAAGLVRRRYTSPERWARLVPPGEMAAMHGEQSVRDAQRVIIVGDLRTPPHAVLPLDTAAGDWYCRTCEQSFGEEPGHGSRCPNEGPRR